MQAGFPTYGTGAVPRATLKFSIATAGTMRPNLLWRKLAYRNSSTMWICTALSAGAGNFRDSCRYLTNRLVAGSRPKRIAIVQNAIDDNLSCGPDVANVIK